ncbi:MAG: hypothetical protein AAGD11_13595 [Planctomycetota bacterium]
MIRITVDEAQKQQLLNSEGEVELCDESGRVIAKATPLPLESIDPQSIFSDLTDEEIERRANGPGPWYSTEEVKEFLKNPESRPW